MRNDGTGTFVVMSAVCETVAYLCVAYEGS